MSVEQHKDALKRGAEAFNNPADRSGWLELHAPSVVAYGLGPDPLGLDGLGRFYAGLWSGFPDLRLSIEDLIGEGHRISWRLSVRGTHEGEFRGLPPTGTEVRFGAQYIFEFEDGEVVKRWTNFDRLGVLVQLGAIPAPV